MLTAAHCLHGLAYREVRVKVGDHDSAERELFEDTFDVHSWRVHPDFQKGKRTGWCGRNRAARSLPAEGLQGAIRDWGPEQEGRPRSRVANHNQRSPSVGIMMVECVQSVGFAELLRVLDDRAFIAQDEASLTCAFAESEEV